jgi:two-component system OmpR family response regulator
MDQKKILIVEDDPAIAELLAHALRRVYAVTTVTNGTEGLAVASRERPDLVMLDVNLPGMDGFAIAEALKGSDALRRTPIIFLTARDHSLDVIRGINAGAKHYITKPFKLDEVMIKVQKLIPVAQ